MGQEIQITAADGGRFAGYLALPSRTPAPGLVVLPEVFNTNAHIRSVADGYAAEGFVVIAPDVYWRQEAGCYASYTDEGRAKAQSLRARLDTDQFARDLGDVIAALRARPDCTGKVGVMGFCLGGKFAYLSGTRHAIDAAVSYYGVQIDQHLGEADRLKCPILLHFAEKDPHVPANTVEAIRDRMTTWEKVTIHVYPGTEHGFNRYGYPPYHEAAAGLARERTLAHFRRLLSYGKERGMSANEIKRIDARALKAQLHDGGELALLDAREELPFGRRHLLMASCVPLSRMELLVDDLVPRRGARVVWCDDGEGLAARAAARMAALGYQDIGWLDGGIAAWEAAGFRIYSGVHVPSKAFAEVVEHEAGTPWISAQELQALIDRKADIAIYDSRSYEEYHNNSIPTAISVPGAELVYRFADLTPSPDTTVIVNCGGRTRSIIGAQSLINAGVRNKIVSLKDGTMAWHLADLDVVHGATQRPPEVSAHGLQSALEAAARVAARCDIARIDRRTLESWRAEATERSLYVLDVRSPEEYEAGHLRGARLAPGGQLVQETDSHMATWGARVVLVDDNGVRATMTASWLKQMGWPDVAVLVAGPADGDWVTGRRVPRVLGLEATSAPGIDVVDLRDRLAAGKVVVIDLDLSRRYALGHIPGAWFANRSRLGPTLANLPANQTIVLTSADGVLAVLAAAELQAAASVPVMTLTGGTQAWIQAGLPLEIGTTHMAHQADDVFLSPRERGQNREDAMREYLTWEINLVNDMAKDDDHRFRVVAG